MTIRFEAALAKDLPQMVELLGQLFEQEAEFTPNAAKQEAALKLIFSTPSYGKLFVAKDGSKVVAMASLLYTVSTAEGGRAALFEDLVVRPDYRAGAHRRPGAHHPSHRHAERARPGPLPQARLRRLADEADAPEDQAEVAAFCRSEKIFFKVRPKGSSSALSSRPRLAISRCSSARW
jgi:hypothetical protein